MIRRPHGGQYGRGLMHNSSDMKIDGMSQHHMNSTTKGSHESKFLTMK